VQLEDVQQDPRTSVEGQVARLLSNSISPIAHATDGDLVAPENHTPKNCIITYSSNTLRTTNSSMSQNKPTNTQIRKSPLQPSRVQKNMLALFFVPRDLDLLTPK